MIMTTSHMSALTSAVKTERAVAPGVSRHRHPHVFSVHATVLALQATAGNRSVAEIFQSNWPAGSPRSRGDHARSEKISAPILARLGWRLPAVQRQEAYSGFRTAQVNDEANVIESWTAEATNVPKDLEAWLPHYEKLVPAVLNAVATYQADPSNPASRIPVQNAVMIMAQAEVEHSPLGPQPPGNMIFGVTTASTNPDEYVRTRTTEVKKGKLVKEEGRKFRKYSTPEASVTGYLNVLGNRGPEGRELNLFPSGNPLTQLSTPGINPQAFLDTIVKSGYSTNPEGAWDEQCNWVGGYREQYPDVFNRLKGHLKRVLPILRDKTEKTRILYQRQKSAYDALAAGCRRQLDEQSTSNEASEQLRQDLSNIAVRAKQLDDQIKELDDQIARFKALEGSIQSLPTMARYRSPKRNTPCPRKTDSGGQ